MRNKHPQLSLESIHLAPLATQHVKHAKSPGVGFWRTISHDEYTDY